MCFREVVVKNNKFLVGAGSMRGYGRKLVVMACYLPPDLDKRVGSEALRFIGDTVAFLKKKFKDPNLIIAGDFNQWKIPDTLSDFVGISEVQVGPTRGSRSIDRIFSNIGRSVTESGSLAPLETEEAEDGSQLASDHRVAYARFSLQRRSQFKWEMYTYRHYSQESEDLFTAWVVFHEWEEVRAAVGSEAKAIVYQETVQEAINRCFTLKMFRKKTTDLPWMSKEVKDRLKKRKGLYMAERGIQAAAWKESKKETDALILKRKRGFLDKQ